MSEGPVSFFEDWDFELEGDNSQWQQIFDQQLRVNNDAIAGVTGADAIEAPGPSAQTDSAPVVENASAHDFDQVLLDPALLMDVAHAPLTSIDEHDSVASGDNSSRSLTRNVRGLGEESDQGHWAGLRDIPSISPATHLYGYTRWPDADSADVQQFVPQLATSPGNMLAPTANLPQSMVLDSERPEQFENVDRDWLGQTIDLSLAHRDLRRRELPAHDAGTIGHGNFAVDDWLTFPSEMEADQHDVRPQESQPYPTGHHFATSTATQVPDHDLHLAYRHQPTQSSSSPHFDSSFSPEADYTPDIFSPSPGPSEFSPEPELKPRRSRSTVAKNPNTVVMKTSVNCVAPGCGRPFRNRTHTLDLCARCARKHDRRTAEAQPNNLDPEVPDMTAARQLIYPPQPGRGPPLSQDELTHILSHENSYIQRLLDAVNFVVPGGSGGNVKAPGLSWEARQQITFNQKLRMEGSSHKGAEGLYRRPLITARLRALFLELYQFHTGATESFYAIGGNNAGYNPDTSMGFHERFENVAEFLRDNKRMVMDVVEGRGVKSIVANPKGYNKRKVSNNACNEDKKEIMGVGKERLGVGTSGGGAGGGDAGGGMGKGKKRRRYGGDEVVGGGGEGEQRGNSGGAKRLLTRASRVEHDAQGSSLEDEQFEMRLRDALKADWDMSGVVGPP